MNWLKYKHHNKYETLSNEMEVLINFIIDHFFPCRLVLCVEWVSFFSITKQLEIGISCDYQTLYTIKKIKDSMCLMHIVVGMVHSMMKLFSFL